MREPWEIVDLGRYPIADPESPEARSLVAACRAQLAESSLCLLLDFVTADALAAMTAEAEGLLPQAHHTEHWRASAHGKGGPGDGTIPEATRASIDAIANDRLAADSPLRRLYEWDALTAFVAAVLGGQPLHRTADPLVSCMLTVCHRGDELGWHYDPNDGVVSLLLQASEAGGAFEFAPGIRGEDPEAEAAERAVLEGRCDKVLRPPLAPGTLSLFNGHRALHRVAPVTGRRARIIALFNYTAEPGYRFSDDIRSRFFGRVA